MQTTITAGPFTGRQALVLIPVPDSHFRFLDLPYEIRGMISELLFTRRPVSRYSRQLRIEKVSRDQFKAQWAKSGLRKTNSASLPKFPRGSCSLVTRCSKRPAQCFMVATPSSSPLQSYSGNSSTKSAPLDRSWAASKYGSKAQDTAALLLSHQQGCSRMPEQSDTFI